MSPTVEENNGGSNCKNSFSKWFWGPSSPGIMARMRHERLVHRNFESLTSFWRLHVPVRSSWKNKSTTFRSSKRLPTRRTNPLSLVKWRWVMPHPRKTGQLVNQVTWQASCSRGRSPIVVVEWASAQKNPTKSRACSVLWNQCVNDVAARKCPSWDTRSSNGLKDCRSIFNQKLSTRASASAGTRDGSDFTKRFPVASTEKPRPCSNREPRSNCKNEVQPHNSHGYYDTWHKNKQRVLASLCAFASPLTTEKSSKSRKWWRDYTLSFHKRWVRSVCSVGQNFKVPGGVRERPTSATESDCVL